MQTKTAQEDIDVKVYKNKRFYILRGRHKRNDEFIEDFNTKNPHGGRTDTTMPFDSQRYVFKTSADNDGGVQPDEMLLWQYNLNTKRLEGHIAKKSILCSRVTWCHEFKKDVLYVAFVVEPNKIGEKNEEMNFVFPTDEEINGHFNFD